MPAMRVCRNGEKGRGKAPVQEMPKDLPRLDGDGDAVDEAYRGTVQGDGQPDAQRREAEGHNGFRRHIVEDGVRMEDEGIHGGVRDTEKGDAVGEMLDRRGAGPGQRGRVLQVRGRQEAQGLLQEPGSHRLRGRLGREQDRVGGRAGPHHLRGVRQDVRPPYPERQPDRPRRHLQPRQADRLSGLRGRGIQIGHEGIASEAPAGQLLRLRAQALPPLPRRRPDRIPRDIRGLGGVQILRQGGRNRRKGGPFGIVLLPDEGDFQGKRPIPRGLVITRFVNSPIYLLNKLQRSFPFRRFGLYNDLNIWGHYENQN